MRSFLSVLVALVLNLVGLVAMAFLYFVVALMAACASGLKSNATTDRLMLVFSSIYWIGGLSAILALNLRLARRRRAAKSKPIVDVRAQMLAEYLQRVHEKGMDRRVATQRLEEMGWQFTEIQTGWEQFDRSTPKLSPS